MPKLSFLLAITLAMPAAAQESLPDVHVIYQDLNLASLSGMKVLDHRIAAAIERACPDPAHIDLRTAREINRCRHDKAVEAASQRARVLAAAQSETRVASAR